MIVHKIDKLQLLCTYLTPFYNPIKEECIYQNKEFLQGFQFVYTIWAKSGENERAQLTTRKLLKIIIGI